MSVPNIQILLEQADRLFGEQKVQQAIQIYKIIINRDCPQKQHKILGLGSIRHQRGYYQGNAPHWYLSQISSTHNNNAYDALSLCFSMTHDYDQALVYYKKMTSDFPENYSLKFGLANLYNNQGNISQAITEYEEIYIHSKNNQNEALRELVLITFAMQEFNQCKQYLQKINQDSKCVHIQAIASFFMQDPQQKNIKFQQLIRQNRGYVKLHTFLAIIYETLSSDFTTVVETYRNCINFCNQSQIFYATPFICLAQYHRKHHQYEQSLRIFKELIDRYGDNWLYELYLAEDYFKVGQTDFSLQCYKTCLYNLEQSDQNYLNQANKAFIFELITEDIKMIQKYSMHGHSKPQISLTHHLYSAFQEDINVNITSLRTKNPNLFSFLQKIQGNALIENASQLMYDLYNEKQMNLQLVDLFCCHYILTALKNHQMSLSTISKELQSIMIQQIVESSVEIMPEIDQNQQKKNEYKIKIKKKNIDAFASREIPTYFSKYNHLFMVIKKIAAKAKNTIATLQELIKGIKSNPNLSVFGEKISYKIEQNNEWICINQVIQEILPEISSEHSSFLKEIQRQFATTYHKALPQLMNLMIKKWQQKVTAVLHQRRASKKQIQCLITDWITVQFIFPSQTRAILSLEDIKKWCHESGASIVGLNGQLDSGELLLKVVIKEICCTIKLRVNYRLKLKRFNEKVKSIISSSRNIIFNVFLNVNKKSSYSLLTYLNDLCDHFSYSHRSSELFLSKLIRGFVVDIECIDNWQQFSRYQKLKLSESWVNPRVKRHPQRLLTEVEQHFATSHQIKTQNSAQTQSLDPINILPSTNSRILVRTYSENDINFSSNASQTGNEADRCQTNQLSKRSMFLRPSNESDRTDIKTMAPFEQIPQYNSSQSVQKTFDRLEFKRINSEHQFQQQQIQPNNHQESVNNISHPSLEELIKQNQQLHFEIESFRKEEDVLIQSYISQIGQKEDEIICLSNHLQKCIRNQTELKQQLEKAASDYQARIIMLQQQNKKINESLNQITHHHHTQQKEMEQKINFINNGKQEQTQNFIQLTKQLEKTIEDRNAEIYCLNLRVANLQKQKEESDRLLKEKDDMLECHSSNLKQIETKHAFTLQNLTHENSYLKQRLSELQMKNQEVNGGLRTKLSQLGEISRMHKSATTDLNALRANADELSKQINQKDMISNDLKEKINQQTIQHQNVKDDLEARLNMAQRQNEQLKLQLSNQQNQLNINLSKFSQVQKKLQQKNSTLQSEKNELNMKMNEMNTSLNQMTRSVQLANKEIQLARNHCQKQLQTVENQYRQRLSEAGSRYDTQLQQRQIEFRLQAQREVNAFRSQIDILKDQFKQSTLQISNTYQQFKSTCHDSSKRLEYFKILFIVILFWAIAIVFPINLLK